jgi:hypothetical protein
MKEGDAVVYVIRPKTWTLSALSAVINIDEKPIVLLENNGYAAIPIPAGAHTISEQFTQLGIFAVDGFNNGCLDSELGVV